MEKKINKKALIVSLIFALICCVLIFSYIRNIDKPKEIKKTVKLLVAARDIGPGERIDSKDIATIDISEDSLPDGIENNRESIENFYAKEAIIMGEPFRPERMANAEELSLSHNIPENMRAITVFVSENTVFSNQLKVGDRVDFIGNYTVETLDNKTINFSKIIIQDIEVLAIGPKRLVENQESADTKELPTTITLCVWPEDAEKIAFTTTFANYSLALRGNNDHKKPSTPGVLVDNFVPYSQLLQEKIWGNSDGKWEN
jgi:Flp pilus assembly protein CpaB